MDRIVFWGCCLLVVCCAVSLAPADTFEHSFTSVSTEVPKFNPSAGILTHVKIDFDLVVNSIDMDVNNNVDTEGASIYDGDFMFFGDLSASASFQTLKAEAVGGTDGMTHLARYEGKSITLLNNGDNGSDSDSLSSNLTPFMGTGNASVTISTESVIGSSSYTGIIAPGPWGPVRPSDPAISITGTDYDGSGKVTYTYTVPEPATLGLLAMGGIALLRRGRKQK